MTDGKVCLGDGSSSAEITNSHIDCRKLEINSSELYIKSTKKGGVSLTSSENVELLNSIRPNIFIENDTNDDIRVDIPNIMQFYQFNQFKYSNNNLENEKILRFAAVVEIILDCMRKHRKDAPAKDCDYIDNEIITGNEFKVAVLKNLRKLDIIYVDAKENHLYKLNVSKLKEYDIGWQALSKFGVERYSKLYNSCEWE